MVILVTEYWGDGDVAMQELYADVRDSIAHAFNQESPEALVVHDISWLRTEKEADFLVRATEVATAASPQHINTLTQLLLQRAYQTRIGTGVAAYGIHALGLHDELRWRIASEPERKLRYIANELEREELRRHLFSWLRSAAQDLIRRESARLSERQLSHELPSSANEAGEVSGKWSFLGHRQR
jgi:hypothetical protein